MWTYSLVFALLILLLSSPALAWYNPHNTPIGNSGTSIQLFCWDTNPPYFSEPSYSMSQEGYECFEIVAWEEPSQDAFLSMDEFKSLWGGGKALWFMCTHGVDLGIEVCLYGKNTLGYNQMMLDWAYYESLWPGATVGGGSDDYYVIVLKWAFAQSWSSFDGHAFVHLEICHSGDKMSALNGVAYWLGAKPGRLVSNAEEDVPEIWHGACGSYNRTRRSVHEGYQRCHNDLVDHERNTGEKHLVFRPCVEHVPIGDWFEIPSNGYTLEVRFDGPLKRIGNPAASIVVYGEDVEEVTTIRVTDARWNSDGTELFIDIEKHGPEGGSFLVLPYSNFEGLNGLGHGLVSFHTWGYMIEGYAIGLMNGDRPAAEVAIRGIDDQGSFRFGVISAEPNTKHFRVETRMSPDVMVSNHTQLDPFVGNRTVSVGTDVQARLVQVVTNNKGEDREIYFEWVAAPSEVRVFDAEPPTFSEVQARLVRHLDGMVAPLKDGNTFRSTMGVFAPLSGEMDWSDTVNYLKTFLISREAQVTLVDLNQWSHLSNDDAYLAMKQRQVELYNQGISAFCFIGDSSDAERFDVNNPLHDEWWPDEWDYAYDNLTQNWDVVIQPELAILPLKYFADSAVQGENMCWSGPYGPDYRDLFDVTGDGLPDDVWCRIIPASTEYELACFLDKFFGVMAMPDNELQALKVGTFVGDQPFDDPDDHLKAIRAMDRAHQALSCADFAVEVRESDYYGVEEVYACLDMLSEDLAILEAGWSPFSSSVEPAGGFSKWLGFRMNWLPLAHPMTFMGIVCNAGQTWWPEYPEVGSPVLEDMLFFWDWGGAYQGIAPATGVFLDGATEFAVRVYEGICDDDDRALDEYYLTALMEMSFEPEYPSWDEVAQSMCIFGVPGSPIINPDVVVAVDGVPEEAQFRFVLQNPSINPFSASTSLAFAIPAQGMVSLKIYDVNGRLVNTIMDGQVDQGQYVMAWDGSDDRGHYLASGVYFARLASDNKVATRKLVLVR